jgi:hypothetical protein
LTPKGNLAVKRVRGSTIPAYDRSSVGLTYAPTLGFSGRGNSDNNGYSENKNFPMSEIPSDWSLAALLSFGGAFTALAAGAAIFLAESWFQKMRQRREHFKIWQDRRLKICQEQQRESILRPDMTAKKAQSKVNQGVRRER